MDMMEGFYLEDFEIGKTYIGPGRTVTEADVVNYAGLSGDFNPLHMDEEFAKKNMFGKRIAHGLLGPVMMAGMSNQTGMMRGTTIAFMEQTERYVGPLQIGDTMHLEMTPTEIKHSSKPGRGILKMHCQLKNQDGKVTTDSDWTLMMKSRT